MNNESRPEEAPAAGEVTAADVIHAWSLYWQQDRLHACVPVSDVASAAELAAAWRAFFAALAPGCRVLDLGTGNGAVALEAVTASSAMPAPLEIHGVDLADIAPARCAQSAAQALASVHFHPRTAMESLPFADAGFAAVSGQYALEYSRTAESVPEILRVLQPGGCFRFLLHAGDSVLERRSRLQRQQARAILDSPLFVQLRATLEAIVVAESRGSPASLEAAKLAIAGLGATLTALERRFAIDDDHSLPDELLAAVRQLPALRQRVDLAGLLAMADDILARLAARAARLAAMEAAALDLAGTEDLARLFADHGADGVVIETAAVGPHAAMIGRWLHGSAGTPSR